MGTRSDSHLLGEGRGVRFQTVAHSDARKKLVENPHRRAAGRHEAADLSVADHTP